MTYEEFVNHIESLPEYKNLRKRMKPFKTINTVITVPTKVSVEVTWGLNEATPNDFDIDFYEYDIERQVHSDPALKAKIAEQKKAVKAYLKDMKALIKREAKKAGLHKEGILFTVQGGQVTLDNVFYSVV